MAEAGSKFRDIQRYLSDGRFPPTFCPAKKKNLKRYAQKFLLEGGCLYYVGPKKDEKREVVVDGERRRQIFLECHLSDVGCHLGQKKTVHRIQSRYYWLGIVKDVVDWIKICDTCQHAEHYKHTSRRFQPVRVTRPWEMLVLDLLGPFPETVRGNTYVLTVIDCFSKWVEAIPLQQKDALSVAGALAATFYRFGASKEIFSNENRIFCDEVNKRLFEHWNINHKVTPAEHLQYTCLDGSTTGILKAAIRNAVNGKQKDWDDCLDPILFEFRTSVNSSTKFTPFFLLYNREAQLSSEVEDWLTDRKPSVGQIEAGMLCVVPQGELPSALEHRLPDNCAVKRESLDEFTASMSEQQSAVKEVVIANLAAAHKREKKHAKRKARKEIHFSTANANPARKKTKKNHFLSFQIETTLSSEHDVSGGVA